MWKYEIREFMFARSGYISLLGGGVLAGNLSMIRLGKSERMRNALSTSNTAGEY